MWECMGHSGLENRINNKWSRMNTSLRQGQTAIDDALGLPIPCTSTSTSTLFHKTIGYNRLARKIAIANLGGPVKRKINWKEKKGKEKERKTTNKYFNTEITKLLIELFQLLRASQYSHLLFLRYLFKISCTAFSQAFSVNSLRWRFRGERAGNFLKDWASSGWIWNVICQNERMTDSLYYTWQDFERWEERLKLSAQKKALFMYFHMPYTPLPFASFRMQ